MEQKLKLFNKLTVSLGVLLCGASPIAFATLTAVADGNILKLNTNRGNKVFFGDVGFSELRNYKIEIPLSEFGPQGGQTSGQSGGVAGADLPNTPSLKSGYNEANDTLIVNANALYNSGKFREALSYVDEILVRDPGSSRGWVMKGSLMHALKHPDLAKNSWKKALELEPNNEQIQNILKRYP